MNILLFGSTGKVGRGVLQVCLQDEAVSRVVVVNRRSLGVKHEKLEEIVTADVSNLQERHDMLKDIDGCLYCIGTTNFFQPEESFRKITVDLTMQVARTVHTYCPQTVFCYISGAGVGNKSMRFLMPIRVKADLEEQLFALLGDKAYMLRPGYIHMSAGVPQASGGQKMFYTMLLIPLRLLIRQVLYPYFATTTEALGTAMLTLVKERPDEQILECEAINK